MRKNDIFIIHGTDYKNMAKRILEQMGVAADIGDVDKKVALKPSLVTAKTPSSGAITYSELLAGVIEYFQEHDFQDTIIMEGSQVGNRTEDTSRAAGYHQACSRYDVSSMDLQRDTWKEHDAGRMKIKLCDKAAVVDYMVNMPALKGRRQTTVTRILKDSKGVIPNLEERRFHILGLHEPIIHLNATARNSLILVDSIYGDPNFEEGDNPVVMDCVLDLKDPVLCDTFVCDCMDYSVDDVPCITMTRNLDVGSTDTAHANMICLSRAAEAYSKFRVTRRVQHLAAYTTPEGTCSACYDSLIYALGRLNDMGYLGKGLPPVYIDQGYKGQGSAIGVDQCTSCFVRTLGGCPPKAADIVGFLGNQWQ